MLVRKILKKDFLRKKSITIVVFAFMLLAAWLAAGGANLIVELSRSLNALFAAAHAPHFVQMHAGEIDQGEIARWAAANSLVKAQQTVEMITVDGSGLYLGETAEENSIMDISVVRQNEDFDFLLDLDNRIIQVAPGEIAVPIYYMQRDNLKIGDTVRISQPSYTLNFTIAAFVRDAQMNPAIVHSKRFVVHEADYARLAEHIHDKEYLIEFLLTDPSQVNEFSQAYLSSDLPKKGPSVDSQLFKTLNALTDGIVAGVVIVLSLLLLTIAILCLRFTMLATIEEDYKEIGVMKAIGIAPSDIKRIYLSKYVVMGGLASLLGYLAALAGHEYFAGNITLYIGRAPRSLLQYIIPAAAAAAIALIVVVSCMIILRRFNRISAVEALRSGTVGGNLKRIKRLRLALSRVLDVNILLGLRDVVQRFRMFGLLCFVFFFCACIIIIPIHFLTTMTSPTFISYMGIGKSDLRIDLRQSEHIAERFEDMLTVIATDADVARFTPLVTSQFQMVQANGELDIITIETGDFSLFPLDYLEGAAPQQEDEIALSVLNAQDRGKQVGDSLVLLVNGEEKTLTVSGIYQDVTNGGRTAKTALPYNPETVLWYTVSLDLKSPDKITEKVHEYSAAFYPARITDLEGYVAQTLGNTIQQLRKVTVAAIVVGLLVAMLMTSLFLNMLIARDASQIAIMKGLGFSLRHIRIQYLTKAIALLVVGIILGTLFSNTVGQRLVSVLWGFMGASHIRFVIDPVQAYLLLPLLLLGTVTITTIISIAGIKDTSIIDMIVE
ncbi:FtsX-like permease family protein [candidate division KSB3 bacterium]|uniref:FtsX-like permease family protein n=1 Tax=candidate division KSB3 bacterium TaxID=2044937 RepID=A0A9D5Q724_9BACT|nr:FtsX-like permease family protein [candidate division KSB3 bacterium]MBD3325857.1 FtsX-like permease family protein [candidate division KSB3 bacterium]